MSHFTYNSPEQNILKQGDIIRKNDTLLAIIKEVHPYFSSNNYSHFLVLTQSCDLIRRDSSMCKSKYITIAAVRQMDECLKREVKPILKSIIEKKTFKIIDEKNKPKLRDTVEKLLNNNHPDYFYLHESVEHGLANSLVAFLRVSIALKVEHYDSIVSGKILELKDEFKAKLGWLVGNLYSRVGTEDWVPNTIRKEEFNQMINDVLNANFVFTNLSEIEKSFKEQIESDITENMAIPEIMEKLSSYPLISKKERAMSAIEKILQESQGSQLNKIMARLRSDSTLSSLLK